MDQAMAAPMLLRETQGLITRPAPTVHRNEPILLLPAAAVLGARPAVAEAATEVVATVGTHTNYPAQRNLGMIEGKDCLGALLEQTHGKRSAVA
jgi:hypothetical protein